MSDNKQLALLQGNNLPAHIQKRWKETEERNRAAAAGISGSFPKISTAGSKFHIQQGGESRLINDPNNPKLPLMQLDVVIVGWSEYINKAWYAVKYKPGDASAPDCHSDTGIAPNPDVPEDTRQSDNCATCPRNQWGSAISEYSGKEIKACQDGKRLAVVPVQDLSSGPYALDISPTALKEWKKYVDMLTARNVPLDAAITGLTFDPTVDFPKLQFSFLGFVDEEDTDKVASISDGPEVLDIVSPRRVAAGKQDVKALPTNVTKVDPEALAVGAKKVPVAKPVEEEVEATKLVLRPTGPQAVATEERDDLDHLPPKIKAMVLELGPDDPAVAAIMMAYPAPKKPEYDPFNGVPEHLLSAAKTAVEAAGGWETATAQMILDGFAPDRELPPKKRTVNGVSVEKAPEPEVEDEPEVKPEPVAKTKKVTKKKVEAEAPAEEAPAAQPDENDLMAKLAAAMGQ